ncbi:colony stimulating factor 3 (granulocyte) a [Pholidichthys leucotaenia]
MPCYMAAFTISAPLPENSPLVEDPDFQEMVQRSNSLIQKIMSSIPDAHKACIHTKTLQLNSSENARLQTMAATIGIPPPLVVKAVSENFTLENSLRQMYEGLQLHRALLTSIFPQLEDGDPVTELTADIRDLANQINKMLQLAKAEPLQQNPSPVALHLPGDYEVQVAAHLTLVQLQSFGQDMVRSLRGLDLSTEEDSES